jgi:CubicO group peptidase (beta-lactamase class C family)
MKVSKRISRWIGFAILLAAIVLIIVYRPDRVAKAAAGLTAHNLCAATFTAGLDPDATFRELVQPMIPRMGRLIWYRVDRPGSSVTASFAGAAHATARFTTGYGCRLEYPEDLPPPRPRPLSPRFLLDNFAPPTTVAPTDPTIASAMDRVFSERPDEPIKDVKALVVVKNGHVIAERYSPGFGIDTPLLSYSVAKSFTNALLGILVRQGRLRVDQPAGAPEWAKPDDPRGRITIEELLQMRSGLDAEETGTGFDPAAQMLFNQSDMAGFAARHRLKAPPGTHWEYTSINILILDRLLGNTVGGGAPGMREFAERELFNPLNMTNITMEFDGRGVFVGSSYVYAPARAFARFGDLYVNDGIAPDGHRILPEGWVAWSRSSVLGAAYGAGFRTNDGPNEFAAWRVEQGFPKDGFYADGYLGQRIYIVPSEHIAVARFGYSRADTTGMQEEDDYALIATVIRATHGAQ